ncbi:hypothetical protein DPMN_074529 [Dreissena polymorpha]|uniref:Uncharacterized protein n=1 Tax=Dreissena polymorpha TaxID=45954 RepID=A0A9D4BNG8_DREPO|nr:hypothetical protein DPMN_074529 [Dreissena polymorpha]
MVVTINYTIFSSCSHYYYNDNNYNNDINNNYNNTEADNATNNCNSNHAVNINDGVIHDTTVLNHIGYLGNTFTCLLYGSMLLTILSSLCQWFIATRP